MMHTMADERQALLGAARALESSLEHVGFAQVYLVDEDLPAARVAVDRANDHGQRAARLLHAAGVSVPPAMPHEGADIPLDQLDTHDARELLATLRQALVIAERVDGARGRSFPDDTPLRPGESRGTDLAESISELVLRLRIEVEGPKGHE
jgi:hypothetical protein